MRGCAREHPAQLKDAVDISCLYDIEGSFMVTDNPDAVRLRIRAASAVMSQDPS